MAWRNQGITGSNNIPLGRRRMGGEDGEEESRTVTPSSIPCSRYVSSKLKGENKIKTDLASKPIQLP